MSEPHYSSSEIGNVDASTVVVTFDQDVSLFVAPPTPPVLIGHGSGIVDSASFAEWLSTRPKMGWPKIPRRKQEPVTIVEPVDTQAQMVKENQNRVALLTALMAIDDE